MTRRTLSVLLALCMLMGLLPFGAFAAQEDFSDVPADAWYAADVAYAAGHALMNGVGGGKFDPDGTTTRAMLVTILHRLEGTPAAAKSAFTDVPAGEWYTAAVDWAAANKIVEGMDAKTFAPASPVTREQFAVILYRYANFKGMDTAKKADLSAFSDAASVSAWAADAMAWANAAGLVNGVSKTELAPQGSATRAQAAAILGRFDRMVKAGEAKPGTVTLSADKTEATITEPRQTFTGTYTVENDQIDRIDWVQHSDVEAYEGVTGTAMIDQTKGTWEAADVLLAPGANTITFTAYTKNGASAEQTVEITFDSGEIADYTNSDITYTDDNGNGYVNNVILVTLDAGYPSEQREEALKAVCKAVNGEVIGAIHGLEIYQIRVEKTDEATLLRDCEIAMEASKVVAAACLDTVVPSDAAPEKQVLHPNTEQSAVAMALPAPSALSENDPWENSDWDEANPGEANWWAEATYARYAWSYGAQGYFNPIKVGIMDGAPYDQHEDLNVTILPGSYYAYQYHGTHVAGLIGATHNNDRGLAGMCPTAQMYSIDTKNNYTNARTTALIFSNCMNDLLSYGCKVLNASQGYHYFDTADLSSNISKAAQDSATMTAAINNGVRSYGDFLICQSAGNGYDQTDPTKADFYEPYDAQYIGLFLSAAGSARDRVIVVGAAQEKADNEETARRDEYQLVEWSNTGDQVDVAAPGTNIYSTMYYDRSFLSAHSDYPEYQGISVGDWGYDYQQGTSMAAPITTGLTAMIWSVNPDFTAADVKQILIGTAGVCYRNEGNTTSGVVGFDARDEYPMINAQAAVEEAIARTYGDGTLNVSFVNVKNNQPMNNVSYEIRLGSATGTVVASGTANGSASITLPRAQGTDYHQAQYYIVASNGHDTWTSANASTVNVGQTTNVTAALNVPDKINAYRVVLTWNAEPADLDAHLVAGNGGHVYYKAKSINGAVMDLDDTQSFGPETITVTDVEALGGFTYSVHDFTNRATFSDASGLASSGATVRVYAGNALVKTYTVPANMFGTVWNVFSVDADGTITDGGAFKYSGNGAAIAVLFPMKPAATAAALSAQPAWKSVEPDKS